MINIDRLFTAIPNRCNWLGHPHNWSISHLGCDIRRSIQFHNSLERPQLQRHVKAACRHKPAPVTVPTTAKWTVAQPVKSAPVDTLSMGSAAPACSVVPAVPRSLYKTASVVRHRWRCLPCPTQPPSFIRLIERRGTA